MPLSPGATLERYEIVRLVDRGGMGEVYRSCARRLVRPVAAQLDPRPSTPWVAIAIFVALAAVGVGGVLAFALR